jgi:hypothetical protein
MELLITGAFKSTLYKNIFSMSRGPAPTVSISNGMLKIQNTASGNYFNAAIYDPTILGSTKFSFDFEGVLDPSSAYGAYVLIGTWFFLPNFGSATDGGIYLIGFSRKYTGSVYEVDNAILGAFNVIAPTEVGYNINDGAETDSHRYSMNYEIVSNFDGSGNLNSVLNTQIIIDGVLQKLNTYGFTVDWGLYDAGVPVPLGPGFQLVNVTSNPSSISIKRWNTNNRTIEAQVSY